MSTGNGSSLTGTSKRRKRTVEHNGSSKAEPAAVAKLAPFRSPDVSPVNIRAWPMKSEGWLEPEFGLMLPGNAGLRIERRCSPPTAGFQLADVAPDGGRMQFESPCEFVPASVKPAIPAGDIIVLGWNARATLQSREGV